MYDKQGLSRVRLCHIRDFDRHLLLDVLAILQLHHELSFDRYLQFCCIASPDLGRGYPYARSGVI